MTAPAETRAIFDTALERGDVVIIYGTGVSASSSEAPTATWRGLIDFGITRATDLGAAADWAQLARQLLTFGFTNGDSGMAVAAATQVEERLKAADQAAFPTFLKDSIGRLQVQHAELGDALRALPYPLLTTNYDLLVEGGQRQAVSWTEPFDVQQVLTGRAAGIVHLHGIWSRTDTVIFTSSDYSKILSSEAIQHLERAVSSTKTIVYVGFGAGLGDPNFGSLIAWHKRIFSPSSVDHFILCRDDEFEALDRAHAADHIYPVSYGNSYSDLPPFLTHMAAKQHGADLTEAGVVRDIAREARESFGEQLRQDSILTDTREDSGELAVDQLVVAPVMLPVPHAEYVRSRGSSTHGDRVERLDPAIEASRSEVLVVAGEEGAGLTTAIRWLALAAATSRGSVPLLVEFKSCRRAPKPLDEQIRRQFAIAGIKLNEKTPTPTYVLALDDFTPFIDRISDRVLSEVARTDADLVVVGCRAGLEDEVVDRLRSRGKSVTVRYLGSLSAGDVRRFAEIAAPDNFDKITQQVLQVLQMENLPRTPYTVALLIAVLIQSGALTNNASQTSILDDYVGLLLGRGDPHEDARLGLDQPSREAVLSAFAQRLVESNVGGLPEAAAVRAFEEIFGRYGWLESPTEALRSFVSRRILKRTTESGTIAFARNSYLYLFAAKRATIDDEFRSRVIERPIFYSAIVSDYAALYRHDADLVRALTQLLDDETWNAPRSTVFDEVAPLPALPEGVGQVGYAEPVRDSPEDVDEYFDTVVIEEPTPFPLLEETNVPPAVRLLRSLEVVSSALRDSDQIEDLSLKQHSFEVTVQHWGTLMNVVASDQSFQDFLRDLLDGSEIFATISEERRTAAFDELIRALPAAIATGGITLTLASRKLSVVAGKALADGGTTGTDESAVSAAIFEMSVRDDGWIARVRTLVEGRAKVWVVRNFVLPLLIRAFVEDEVRASQSTELLNLCLDLYQESVSYADHARRVSHRNELSNEFRQVRLTARTRKQVHDVELQIEE